MQVPPLFLAIAAFGAAALLVAVISDILSVTLKRYEEEVLKGAEMSFDQIYLTIPARQLGYVALLLFFLFATLATLFFGSLWMGLAVGLVALFTPRLLAWHLRRRRIRRFGFQLVDALMNISNALRSGFSLPQAFELIQREMDAPIRQEFRLLNQETRVGVPMETALQNFSGRMPSEDLDLVVTAILVSQEVGGSLAEVMDNIAKTIRERHTIEGKINALTSQGRLQAIILCLVPFALAFAINTVNPDFFYPMLHEMIGWVLFGVVGVLEVIGILIVRKIISIEI